jgi:hypothetical protein
MSMRSGVSFCLERTKEQKKKVTKVVQPDAVMVKP